MKRITGYRHCVLVAIERITGQIAGYSGQTSLLITGIGLWSGRIGFIIVFLYELVRVSQLIVINFLK